MIFSFLRQKHGSVAPLFGLIITLLIAMGGVSMQYSKLYRDQGRMQAAVDAAVLAGARTVGTNQEKIAMARDFYRVNIGSEFDKNSSRIKFFVKDGVLYGTSSINPDDYFAPFVEDVTKLSVAAGAKFSDPPNLEISLVLDYSDSMGANGKLDEMRGVVDTFIDKMKELQDHTSVQVGLAPFAALSGIRMPRKFVADNPFVNDLDGDDDDKTYTGCTGDRKHPYNNNGAGVRTNRDDSKWGHGAGGYYVDNPDFCDDFFLDKNIVPVELDNDLDDIRSKLAKIELGYMTHLSLGMDIGLQILNPDAPFTGGAAFNSTKTNKYLVFLTDGAQSVPAFGPDNSTDNSVDQGWDNLVGICEAAKDENVTVMTVAYDIEKGNAAAWIKGDEARKLKECASEERMAFKPGASNGDLAAAFQEIYGEISNSIVHLVN